MALRISLFESIITIFPIARLKFPPIPIGLTPGCSPKVLAYKLKILQEFQPCYLDIAVWSCLLLSFSNLLLISQSFPKLKFSASHQDLNLKNQQNTSLFNNIPNLFWIPSHIKECTFWTSSSLSISPDASDALGGFLRRTSNVSSVSSSIPP